MMRFELGLEEPNPKRAPISAGTIAASYLVGGLIPLAPYMLASIIAEAFIHSVGFTALALIIFGGIKGHFTGINKAKSAGQTLLVGGLAAAAAPTAWHTPSADRLQSTMSALALSVATETAYGKAYGHATGTSGEGK